MTKAMHFWEVGDDDSTWENAEWSLGPSRVGFGHFTNFLSDPDLAERDYFYLGGHILKWYHLYGKFPPADSWVWRSFPSGDRWLQAVQTYGKDAVDRATSQYYYSVDGDKERRSAFHNHAVDSVTNFQNTASDTDGLVIFLHVTTDSEEGVVREQLRAAQSLASDRAQKISLYYSVVGASERKQTLVDEIEAVCQDERQPNVTCSALRHFSVPYEGETLRQLHVFCRGHPHSIVSYVQSDLPPYMKQQIGDLSQRYNLLLHLSRAALTPQCIEAVRSNYARRSSCNTCGLVFYKFWTLFYPGNVFTTACEYVNDLLPPRTFEKRMIDYIKAALLARLSKKLQSRVFIGPYHRNSTRQKYQADLLETWGLDGFSVDFWLGSHPNINPCDVSGHVGHNLSYWQGLAVTATSGGNETGLSVYGPAVDAPAHDGSPFHFDPSAYNKALSEDAIRRREVTFFAGHLARWYHLYGFTPDAYSRVWNFFPDGEDWKEKAMKGGQSVVMKALGILPS
jgi:hypothetical protein